MRLLIAIPAFDEAGTIAEVVRGAAAHGPVLVVDDGSTDPTAAVARAAGAEVVRHRYRLGKGQALRTALAIARQRRASHLLTLDADGQHLVDDVPSLIDAAARAPCAVVIGARLRPREPGAAGRLPRGRQAAVELASLAVSALAGCRLRDTQSGLRVYPLSLFDAVEVRSGGFVFETEVLVRAAARGFEIREVPVTLVPRAARASRFRPVGDGLGIAAFLARCLCARAAAAPVRRGVRAAARVQTAR